MRELQLLLLGATTLIHCLSFKGTIQTHFLAFHIVWGCFYVSVQKLETRRKVKKKKRGGLAVVLSLVCGIDGRERVFDMLKISTFQEDIKHSPMPKGIHSFRIETPVCFSSRWTQVGHLTCFDPEKERAVVLGQMFHTGLIAKALSQRQQFQYKKN